MQVCLLLSYGQSFGTPRHSNLAKYRLLLTPANSSPRPRNEKEERTAHSADCAEPITLNEMSLFFKAGEIVFDDVRMTRIFNPIALFYSERYSKVIVKWGGREHIEKKTRTGRRRVLLETKLILEKDV